MFSEEQIKDALEVKDRILSEIQKHKEEIEMLEKNLLLVNSFLKQQSFTKASQIKEVKHESAAPQDQAIPLRKNSDGSLIANAYVTPEQVSIILDEKISLREDVHPFKSFFIDRIIGEMIKKDMADLERGIISEDAMINFLVNKNGATLREIIIKNYRQKERVNEIINTATWSLSKMLDNSK
ncbi:MAG: hypothetical protein QXE84_04535 [Candidatus Nitrosotenuis sp.]|uniref:Uncharacterized protein n=1 Tax=Candidatus Nitrosotenuis uzonensis TaxID=1407055 RepID=A0A812F2Z7_9ARCH|nr:hypothetical protein [Candidatus Nitrosotenuis uzonensis]CAE6493147.1 conserved hypothetical protein [Candidatus Nitrosotenuis uzonensis]